MSVAGLTKAARVAPSVVLAVGFLLATLPAAAQQAAKVWRVGSLVDRSLGAGESTVEAFRQGLRQAGYVVGRDIVIEYRWSNGRPGTLPTLAAELVRLNVDVIFANGTVAALAARDATTRIPIVFAAVGDPIGAGLVGSLARPGSNVTGLSSANAELVGKRLQLLKDALPLSLARIGVVVNPADVSNTLTLHELDGAARRLGITLVPAEVRSAAEIEPAWLRMASERVQAVFVTGGVLTNNHAGLLISLAARTRLPAIYSGRSFVEAGGLMSYTVDFADQYRHAADYVTKIIAGTKPADLPVEQPTKFELVINLGAAKQIGLTLPPALLVRADQVIE
ncbi:MAG: ABC transporter substrate-binding protein [Caldimonas sp.]